MKSRLNFVEFQSRLNELVAVTQLISFSRYDFSGKPFRGVYDKSEFRLMRNTFGFFQTGYFIKGEYSKSETITQLNYEVLQRPIARYGIIVILIIVNTLLIFFLPNDILPKTKSDIFLAANSVFIFAAFIGFIGGWIQKRILEERFKEEFEIEDSTPDIGLS